MCRYDKKIVYFDLIEENEKIGNAGFAKLIWQNGQMRLIINISGLHNTNLAACKLFLLQGDREIALDSLFIKEGQCVFSRLYCGDELNKLDVCFDDAYGLCVNLDGGKKLMALWAEKKIVTNIAKLQNEESEEKKETQAEESEEKRETQAEESEEKRETQAEESVEEQGMQPEEAQSENLEEPKKNQEMQQEGITEQKVNPEGVRTEESTYLCVKGSERIHDDKWRQLEQIFSHVHPFGDKREYLSVEPKDYIVLTRDYQKLANNSFLLHGYYNYRHTILGKIPDQQGGTDQFYLGVPGVFYEREKAVALMFGFESFECAVEPAETGTFGYYMKRVEI